MKLLEKIRQIERIDALIRRKATGSPKQLASRLEISERTVYDCLELMKSMDAPIYYCRNKCSYCYQEPVHFLFGFKEQKLSQNSILGGNSNKEFENFSQLQKFCIDRFYV